MHRWLMHGTGQINAARGHLRIQIQKGVIAMNDQLLSAHCPCRKSTLYGYKHHLKHIQVWPLAKVTQDNSVNTILERLGKFNFQADSRACPECKSSYQGQVEALVERIGSLFDGLCLDCMSRSEDPYDENNPYYTAYEDGFSECCRVKHGQNTHYYSFMGRQEDLEMHKRKRRQWFSSQKRSHWGFDDSDSDNI